MRVSVVSTAVEREGAGWERQVFFSPTSRAGVRGGHPTSSATRHRSPFDDERKKGGKAHDPGELSIRRSIQAVACEQPPLSGMQKVAGTVDRPIVDTCPRTEKARASRRPIGRAERAGAPRGCRVDSRCSRGFAPDAIPCTAVEKEIGGI